MPRGASGVPDTFHRLMNCVTGYLSNIRVCIDDAIVSDPDPKSLTLNSRASSNRPRQVDLKLAPTKGGYGSPPSISWKTQAFLMVQLKC